MSEIGRQRRGRQWRSRQIVDPFCALEVQLALSRLDHEIVLLGFDDGRFARAHHLIAARRAYDQLLGEACRLAGITAPVDRDGVWRVLAEAELRTRGWNW